MADKKKKDDAIEFTGDQLAAIDKRADDAAAGQSNEDRGGGAAGASAWVDGMRAAQARGLTDAEAEHLASVFQAHESAKKGRGIAHKMYPIQGAHTRGIGDDKY